MTPLRDKMHVDNSIVLASACRCLHDMLAEAERHGLSGSLAVEIHCLNGKAQKIRRRLDDTVRPTS